MFAEWEGVERLGRSDEEPNKTTAYITKDHVAKLRQSDQNN